MELELRMLKLLLRYAKKKPPYIISTHDAIYFEVKYFIHDKIPETKDALEIVELKKNRVDWDNADINKYQETLDSLLLQNFDLWSLPENLQILASVIPSSFIQAAEFSAPSITQKKVNFKVFKSEEWLKAEMSAKNASRKWAKAGKPRNVENVLFQAKKETNIHLRSAIKMHNIKTSTNENNTMMNANYRDPKLFSKLVKKKKNSNSGYTALLKYDELEYRGDAQVLAGFFNYHNSKSTPPEVFKSEENHSYYYSTIDVEAISYIVKQRNWKLPQLNFNQVQNLIQRLKVNKSPDIFGFSAKHLKHGGNVSVTYMMQYLNMSFKHMQYGVPCEELVGAGSLVHKAGKKSLCAPQSFRKITVCALLGQLKQMAVCDLTLPILKPLKASSQLGFTPGLFVKMANIMVTEKRAWALAHDYILLTQFLDNTAAFDKTLHPIILSHLFNGGVEDDQWKYFQLLHQNATTHIKWNGNISKEVIQEAIGNRQGGYSSADEWKVIGNPMIKDLEANCNKEDFIAGMPTNVIVIADDVAPCAMAESPREVVHRMQLLLNIVEDHGVQNHMEFGTDKCKLLISARPGKLRAVEALLKDEPGILTFYDLPIKQVEESYIHIGVPQSTRHQSKLSIDYRIAKGQNITYQLQASTQNSLCGISPLSNRKMFISYHQPTFLYGLDTMHLNTTDMTRLEVKYRKVLKNMMSMPDCVSSPLVYLTIGILPATAQRDLEILGLLGQLALCDGDDQNIRNVIIHDLAFFDENFAGWSGLVRKTTKKYGLPDPLQYFDHPWRPDRWRSNCRKVICEYWDKKLRSEAEEKSSSKYADVSSLSTQTPMRIFQQAGINSQTSKEATVVAWLYCGTYFTRELLFNMKKTSSPICACKQTNSENISHFLLYCQLYDNIRQQYIPKFLQLNTRISEILNDENKLIISILDPLSSKLPEEITANWSSIKEVYDLTRKFCFRMHTKREKIYKELDNMI